MIVKWFKALLPDRADQQPEPQPPAVEPPAPGPAAPRGPEDDLRRGVVRAAVEEAARWVVEEVLPYLF
ncbi:hypothetical protein [Streptomyces sp. NPDC055055]